MSKPSDTIPNENPAADSSRDAKGRFAEGNRGGPGNPFGGKVASFRKAVLACVTQEDIQQIVKSLIEMAKDGNFNAAKLILMYVAGKPEQMPPPDSWGWEAGSDMANGESPCSGVRQNSDEPRAVGTLGSSATGQSDTNTAAPSTNGEITVTPPSTNGDSLPMNRKQRRKLLKAQRIAARQRRGAEHPGAIVPIG